VPPAYQDTEGAAAATGFMPPGKRERQLEVNQSVILVMQKRRRKKKYFWQGVCGSFRVRKGERSGNGTSITYVWEVIFFLHL